MWKIGTYIYETGYCYLGYDVTPTQYNLLAACEKGDLQKVTTIVEADLKRTLNKEEALFKIISTGPLDIFQYLLSFVNPNAKDSWGNTLLIEVCDQIEKEPKNLQRSMLQTLLDQGADPKIPNDRSGMKPLDFLSKDLKALQILLTKALPEEFGDFASPLYKSCESQKTFQVAEYLIKSGAKNTPHPRTKKTPADLLQTLGTVKALELRDLLLQRKLPDNPAVLQTLSTINSPEDLPLFNPEDATLALELICTRPITSFDESIAQQLVEIAYINPWEHNYTSYPLLLLCTSLTPKRTGHERELALLKTLLGKGADPNFAPPHMQTPLELTQNADAVQLLLQHGADPSKYKNTHPLKQAQTKKDAASYREDWEAVTVYEATIGLLKAKMT